MRIRLGAAARSMIEVDALDGADDEHDPPSFVSLRAAYEGGEIDVPRDAIEAWKVWDALTELANAADDALGRGVDGEARRFARAACAQLTSAAGRIAREVRQAREERIEAMATANEND